jgi:hypothetical protein
MIVFIDGLQLENKTLEEKYNNKQGFKFTYKGKEYTHKDVFAVEHPDQFEKIREQLKLKGIIK